MRQCVLPVERGGVEGCVGDAEAEEVFVATIPLIFIILVFITFSTNINRIATARNVLNGTLGQSGPSAGFAFPIVADDAVKHSRSVSKNCDDDSLQHMII